MNCLNCIHRKEVTLKINKKEMTGVYRWMEATLDEATENKFVCTFYPHWIDVHDDHYCAQFKNNEVIEKENYLNKPLDFFIMKIKPSTIEFLHDNKIFLLKDLIKFTPEQLLKKVMSTLPLYKMDIVDDIIYGIKKYNSVNILISLNVESDDVDKCLWRFEKHNSPNKLSQISYCFSKRTVNVLIGKHVFTTKDLINKYPKDILDIPGVGKKVLQEINNGLNKVGLKLLTKEEN